MFKKNKNASTPKFSCNTFQKRSSRRLFRNKSNDPRKNNIDLDEKNNNFDNDSFSDFIWKPQKSRNEFIDFNTAQNIYNDSIDKEKKIKNLENNIKELEDKLDKKEKDFNRINMTYARLINRNKNPENNIDKLLDEIYKLKKENKALNININKLKSEHNFIGLSFIADDLEGSQFIEDKCVGDILNGLDNFGDGNKNKFKDRNDDKKEGNEKEENKTKDNYKFMRYMRNGDKKITENNNQKNENVNVEKSEKVNRLQMYNRRYYKSMREREKERENQEKKNENN